MVCAVLCWQYTGTEGRPLAHLMQLQLLLLTKTGLHLLAVLKQSNMKLYSKVCKLTEKYVN